MTKRFSFVVGLLGSMASIVGLLLFVVGDYSLTVSRESGRSTIPVAESAEFQGQPDGAETSASTAGPQSPVAGSIQTAGRLSLQNAFSGQRLSLDETESERNGIIAYLASQIVEHDPHGELYVCISAFMGSSDAGLVAAQQVRDDILDYLDSFYEVDRSLQLLAAGGNPKIATDVLRDQGRRVLLTVFDTEQTATSGVSDCHTDS
ncbi:MAG: hypothetical protein AAGA93_08505 [Actinomycetota bacterium]